MMYIMNHEDELHSISVSFQFALITTTPSSVYGYRGWGKVFNKEEQVEKEIDFTEKSIEGMLNKIRYIVDCPHGQKFILDFKE